MLEKRRSKRFPITLKLEISQLFKQDNVKVSNIGEPIEVINISKHGIGFKCKCVLPLDYYFNAKLCIGSEENALFCVVKIIRIEADGVDNIYGCEFVGMAPVFHYIFEEYEQSFKEE
ncbi:MAG: PilZ domain-containing protein [Lachnospiraceae bacterium]|nr:PilZ domain-containing protein [Lachnospiraceae bacterium]